MRYPFYFLILILFSCTTSGNHHENDEMKSDTLVSESPDTKPEKKLHPYSFSDVNCLLLIDYQKGISSGAYFYTTYTITPDSREFKVRGTLRSGTYHYWRIPYTGDEMQQSDAESDTSEGTTYSSEHYISEKETYRIGDSVYTIYKHHNYNCYDSMCGAKHNHVPFETGITWFSPEFGILVHFDGQETQFNLMESMKDKEVPKELVVKILERAKVKERIIDYYREAVQPRL